MSKKKKKNMKERGYATRGEKERSRQQYTGRKLGESNTSTVIFGNIPQSEFQRGTRRYKGEKTY